MNFEKALEIIKEFEGCKLKAYLDTGRVWTIGYGSTGPDIIEGLIWTKEQAEDRLIKHCEEMVEKMRKSLLYSDLLNENQMCALCSFTYNVGNSAFAHSTLVRLLNKCSPLVEVKEQFKEVADEFIKWVYDNGVKVTGLENRRKKERELFLS